MIESEDESLMRLGTCGAGRRQIAVPEGLKDRVLKLAHRARLYGHPVTAGCTINCAAHITGLRCRPKSHIR